MAGLLFLSIFQHLFLFSFCEFIVFIVDKLSERVYAYQNGNHRTISTIERNDEERKRERIKKENHRIVELNLKLDIRVFRQIHNHLDDLKCFRRKMKRMFSLLVVLFFLNFFFAFLVPFPIYAICRKIVTEKGCNKETERKKSGMITRSNLKRNILIQHRYHLKQKKGKIVCYLK